MAKDTKEIAAPLLQLYEQPLSRDSLRSGWLLFLAAMFSLSSTVFDLKFKQFLGFTIEDNNLNLQFGGISVTLVVALAFPHLLNAVADIFRKRDVDNHIQMLVEVRREHLLQKTADDVQEAMFGYVPDDDDDHDEEMKNLYAPTIQHQETAKKRLDATTAQVVLSDWPWRFRAIRFWVQLFAPLVVAILAIWIGFAELKLAVQALVEHVS